MATTTPATVTTTTPAPVKGENMLPASPALKSIRNAKRLQAKADQAQAQADHVTDAIRRSARKAPANGKGKVLNPAPAPQAADKPSKAQGKAIAAVVGGVIGADDKNQQRISAYGDLATSVETLLGKAGDLLTARLLTATYAALKPDMDDGKLAGAIWKRRAQILGVTVRRFITGSAGSAPRFNLFYVALDSKTCTATVVCLAKPTPAEVKLALSGDQKACNAHMARLFPKGKGKAQGKPEPAPAAQVAMPGKVNKGGAMGALRDLCAQWRPAEMEAAAAWLMEQATAGRAAIAKAKADKLAKTQGKAA